MRSPASLLIGCLPRRRGTATAQEGPAFLPAPVAVSAPRSVRSPLEAIGSALDEAGGLFPEARRQVDEALAAAARPARERPYGQPRASWEEAYRRVVAQEWTAPQPEFHARPFTAPDTAPMSAVRDGVPPPPATRARASTLPRHGRVPQAEATDLAVLRQVHAGMLARWQAERTEAFIADMRHTTGLPAFRRTARKVGWCGLDRPAAEAPPAGQVTGGWTQAFRQIAAAEDAARAELDAVRARYAAQALAAGVAA